MASKVLTDVQSVKEAITQLTVAEADEVFQFLQERRRRTWWVVPSANLAKIHEIMRPVHEATAHLSEEEINADIDEALAEVRHERKIQQQSRNEAS